MTYIVFDAETTVKNNPDVSDYTVGDEWGSPFHPQNKVVLSGWVTEGSSEVILSEGVPNLDSRITKLVGHNVRFDMHYLYKHSGKVFEEWLYNPNNMVWDTQIVEYLLTAQQTKFASLDELSERYGGTLKDSGIKQFWNQGGQTEDLPTERLAPYLEGDVLNTELIYKEQLHAAHITGLLPLIKTQMKALVATWEMRKNGMCFDMDQAIKGAQKLGKKLDKIKQKLQAIVDEKHPHAPSGTLAINSNDVISRIIFGGDYTYYTEEDVLDEDGIPVVFKSGKRKGMVRTKKKENKGGVKGFASPSSDWTTKKFGVFQTGEDVLKRLLIQDLPPEGREYIELILQQRALNKDLETYFTGYSELAWLEEFEGTPKYFIHGDLNMCSTNTGRMSSSKPNLQNLSKKQRD